MKVSRLLAAGVISFSASKCTAPKDPTPVLKDHTCVLSPNGTASGTCEILKDPAYDVIWNPSTKEWSIDTLTLSDPPQTCQEDEPCWDCETMGNKVCGPKDH